jgi:hypothetical protein
MEYHRVFHLTCEIIDILFIVETAHHHRVSEWNTIGSFIQPVILWTYRLLLEQQMIIE